MTLQELLKSKGLSEEQVKAITDEMKQNKMFIASEENLDVRYGKLKTDHDALTAKNAESEKLIEELRNSTKGQEDVQAQITKYQETIANQQKELEKTKLDSALKVALLGAKAVDVDYLSYKIKEQHELKLDEHGNIKGIDDILSSVKTQLPTQFETSAQHKNVEERKLNSDDDPHKHESGITKEQFEKMGYQSRLKLKQESPEVYAKMTGKVAE